MPVAYQPSETQMQITFNTGRQYTQRGQIITARFDPETGKVWFNDHSRMVNGSYTVSAILQTQALAASWEAKPEAFAMSVMRKYDNGGTYDCPIEDYRISRELRESETILQYRI